MYGSKNTIKRKLTIMEFITLQEQDFKLHNIFAIIYVMNEVKYQITQFIFLALLGLAAYWALTHLDTGVNYSKDQVVEDVQEAETNPDQIVNAVNNEIILSATDTETTVEPDEAPVVVPTETNSSYTQLITDLQDLIDKNVTMDSGANGTRVGTVQKFLKEYFTEKTVSIDNDFGPTTKGLVKEFQQEELNGGDGRIGPNTLKKMVEVLKTL